MKKSNTITLPRGTMIREGLWSFDYSNHPFLDWDGVEQDSDHLARTLNPSYLKIKSEWTIRGEVHEDYFLWINDFSAKNGKHFVKGNFEKTVYTDSPETLIAFLKKFPYTEWDYWDI